MYCSEKARLRDNICCNYSRVAFPEVKECEHKASWACPIFKIRLWSSTEQEAGNRQGFTDFFSSLGLPPVSSVHKLKFQLSNDSCSAAGSCHIPVPLQPLSRPLQQLRITGMQQLRSPFSRSPFKTVLFQKGKQWLVLVVLHHSASLLKFTIIKVAGRDSSVRGVSAEETDDPLEALRGLVWKTISASRKLVKKVSAPSSPPTCCSSHSPQLCQGSCFGDCAANRISSMISV